MVQNQESLVYTYTEKTKTVPEHPFLASDAGKSQYINLKYKLRNKKIK